MDEKQRLIKLYEEEMDHCRQIRKDMDSLGEMTDEQLIVLVEKAQAFERVLKGNWNQISGNAMQKEDVLPVLLKRETLKNDFSQIRAAEDEAAILKTDLQNAKERMKQYRSVKRQERKATFHRLLLTLSFGLMAVCSIVFHLLMLIYYNDILIPALLVMTLVPLFLSTYHGYALRQEADASSNEEGEELDREIRLLQQKLEEKESLLRFYDEKYRTAMEEMDEYQMEAYPYAEQILQKLEQRSSYRKARDEYYGVLEILRFRQPDTYLFLPEIFLIEEEMDRFLTGLQEKMRKLDGYLTQTLETA